jgi:predicted O-linked N-acetylglucosamine transferase (SPINDLY family)
MVANSSTFLAATLAHRSGRTDEAVELYKKVVADESGNAQARYLLGCIYMDRGLNVRAAELLEAAVRINGNIPSFHGAYGHLLMRNEREAECLEQFRIAVKLPNAKEDVYRGFAKALTHFQHNGEVLEVLDAIRDKFGYSQQLLKSYIECCSLNSDAKRLREEVKIGLERGWINEEISRTILCKAACMEHKPEEAMRESREWMRKDPDNKNAIKAYADALCDGGFIEECLPYYLKLFEADQENGELAYKIGGVFFRLERYAEAIRFYRLAERELKGNTAMLSPLSYALFKVTGDASNASQMGTAYYYSVRNYQLRKDDCSACMNLSSILLKMLRVRDGLLYYKRAVDLNPNVHANTSSRLFHLNYSDELPREELFEEHKKWNAVNRRIVGASRDKFDNVPDPEKRLKIGFISADFMYHPVSYFFMGACKALMKDFDVCLYSNLGVDAEDDITRQYQREVHLYRNINGMTEKAVQKTVLDDGIDVMVDLSGHTTGNELIPLSMRLAPVQIEWLGYPNTTGLDTMDYRISDNIAEPEGDADKFSSEKILRLPGGFHLYKPSYGIPPECPLPALTTKVITFGSFNNMKKVSVQAIELWCNLMKAVPNSRLVLKDRNLEAPSSMARIKTLFASYGIDFKRITTKGLIKNNFEHLKAYAHMDIALDSYPYNGTTTTCEALVMGCPVVTMAGESHVSRVSASILTHVGHPEWIAKTPEEFVKIGSKLASDVTALSEIRSKLRKELYASPLCDEERMRVELGAAIRHAWREWCARLTTK